MNRLDSMDPVAAQLVSRPEPRTSDYLRAATWVVLAVSGLCALLFGFRLEGNPTDAAARAAALLPLFLGLVDLWAVFMGWFGRPDRTPLRVPLATPTLLLAAHLLAWLWSSHLASFDVLYRLQPLDEGAGIYALRWGSVSLLAVLALGSLLGALLEARLVTWVLVSVKTSAPAASRKPISRSEPDAPLGAEHVYEAQMLLNNLGYSPGRIDGEPGRGTQDALTRFQADAGLEQTGQVTVLTMIELRNRWSAQEAPGPGQTVAALFGHVMRRVDAAFRTTWFGGGKA